MPRLEDESDIAAAERERLENLYGKVWNVEEFLTDFEPERFNRFGRNMVVATEKATGKRGALFYQHYPRFYWGWTPWH